MNTNELYQALSAALATDPSARVTHERGSLVRIMSAITGDYEHFCPITYVAAAKGHGYYGAVNAHTAAHAMDYPQEDASTTIAVADGFIRRQVQKDRQRERRLLLKTVAPYVRKD